MKRKIYSQIKTAPSYKKYLRFLRNQTILHYHLNKSQEDLEEYLKKRKIEREIIEIVLNYFESLQKSEERVFIDERNEENLIQLWFSQYTLCGEKRYFSKKSGHHPNLIIFKFQVEEIENMVKEFVTKGWLDHSSRDHLNIILNNLLDNEYDCYLDLKKDLFKTFNITYRRERGKDLIIFPKKHDFGIFLEKDIKWSNIKQKAISVFAVRLKYIILGGVYFSEKERYMPFFMGKREIQEDIKKHLKFILMGSEIERKESVIHKYFKDAKLFQEPRIRTAYPIAQKFKYLLEIPPITFKIFESIDWDFMNENGFYDGAFIPQEKKGEKKTLRSYIINLHPIPLFYGYFYREKFNIFIEQLLFHEFTHICQVIYARIYDMISDPTDNPFSEQKELDYFLRRAKLRWFEEDKRKGLSLTQSIYVMGGHTPRFMDKMNEFEECKAGMRLRGEMETIYASLYWKLFGCQMRIGKWFMCNPNIQENS